MAIAVSIGVDESAATCILEEREVIPCEQMGGFGRFTRVKFFFFFSRWSLSGKRFLAGSTLALKKNKIKNKTAAANANHSIPTAQLCHMIGFCSPTAEIQKLNNVHIQRRELDLRIPI